VRKAPRLSTPIEYLKGIGPRRAEVLAKDLNITTFRDLLLLFPRRYIDRRQITPLRQVQAEGEYVQVRGRLQSLQYQRGRQRSWLVGLLEDKTGTLPLVWFQGHAQIRKMLQVGQEYLAFGRVSYYRRRPTLPHPEMTLITGPETTEHLRIVPIYPSSEKLRKMRLGPRQLHQAVMRVWEQVRDEIDENLPDYVRRSLRLVGRREALRMIHQPATMEEIDIAKQRLKFEELFFFQWQLAATRTQRRQQREGIIFSKEKINAPGSFTHDFIKRHLPFELTGAQRRVLREIWQDLASGTWMNRLLQGDVGSGKTVVALITMLAAIDNGYQAVMMAPTEILATQHFQTLSRMLFGLPIRIELLTGATPARKKQELYRDIESGRIHIVVGTHALIQEGVRFQRLGLAVIDEQHRFGVAQRARLWQQYTPRPHVLVMTATPIPRTLSMTLYGDLDVSVIDEMPPGRKPIRTHVITERHLPQLWEFIRRKIAEGRQAYVVYPIIEESEKLDYRNLMEGYERIQSLFPEPDYRTAMLHGRMRPAEKDAVMERFARGEVHILVSTTVIEVGVDVPNATIMAVINAERFGLSQLHQLRGRVGRGDEQSYCFLVRGPKVSAEARTRLRALAETNDGFRLAEVDLKLRGPGEITGTRQSGNILFRIADPIEDVRLMELARQTAETILSEDPDLQHPRHQVLVRYLEQERANMGWAQVS